MEKLIVKKNIYLLVFIISLLSILSAIYIEYILEEKPCVLCIYQRIPYLVSIFICFLGYYNNKSFFLIYCLLFIFLISIILSGYHLGIENNIFKEFSGCTTNTNEILDKSILLNTLNNMPSSCKNVTFKLLGFSLAGINFVLSFMIIILTLGKLFYEKN